jgi:hypothetical protein
MTASKKKPGKNKAPALPRKKMGRHTKYDQEIHPLMVWMLAILGKNNKEIAAGLRISTGTLFAWQKKHAEFSSEVKGGKDVANAKVVKALYKRAIGYRLPEKKVIQMPDGTIRKEVTEKEVIPDVGAIKLFLTNRDPDNWKERILTELTGAGGAPLESTIIILPDNGRDKKAATATGAND